MRYLHNITPHEKLLAQGTYTHLVNDEPSGIVEHWSIHQQPDKSLFVRVDWDGRAVQRESVLVEAWINQDSQRIERFDIRAFGTPGQQIHLLRANYQLNDNPGIDARRTLNDLPRQYQEVARSEETWLKPYGTIFEGLMIFHMQRQQITDLSIMRCDAHLNDETAFQLLSDHIHIERDSQESIKIGKSAYECEQINIAYKAANAQTLCLDQYGILLAHKNPKLNITQKLTTYTRMD